MAKSLVIVDSSAKGRIIQSVLGDDFEFLLFPATLKLLPQDRLAVDVSNGFKADYELAGTDDGVFDCLSKASTGSIFVATNPDVAGEGLAQDIAEEISLTNGRLKRVVLNEMTEQSIRAAFSNAGTINKTRADAFRVRRILYHLVNHYLSAALQSWEEDNLFMALVALRLLCEREQEVESYTPSKTTLVKVRFKNEKVKAFDAKLVRLKDKKPEIKDSNFLEALIIDLKEQTFKVEESSRHNERIAPPPPFTTHTLIREANLRLGFSAAETLRLARQLYEGISLERKGLTGLISFYKTASTWVSPGIVTETRELVMNHYGVDYLPSVAREFSEKDGSGEAIRPTLPKLVPRSVKKYLSPDQYNLYSLIWSRFVASQMKDKEVERSSVKIVAGDDQRYRFEATSSTVAFRGYTQVFDDWPEKQPEQKSLHQNIPPKGMTLQLVDMDTQQIESVPRQRFSESTLLDYFFSNGIDVHDVFESALAALEKKRLVVREGDEIIPTKTGRSLYQRLMQTAPDIISIGFAKRIDRELAEIERRGKEPISVLNAFYKPLISMTNRDAAGQESAGPSHGLLASEKCPLCGSSVIVKHGRVHQFITCVNYPHGCGFARISESEHRQDMHDRCEVCQRDMVVRQGPFGRFLACSGYPDCTFTRPYPTSTLCPQEGCAGRVVERRTKQGKVFFGCSRYPECDFSSWQMPVNIACPKCENLYLLVISDNSPGDYYRCPNCNTQFNLDLSARK